MSFVDPLPGEVVDTSTGEVASGDERKISEAQRKRFYAIAKQANWDDAELKTWLLDGYGIESTKDIPVRLYDELVAAVQASQ
jgi:transposase